MDEIEREQTSTFV